MSEGRLPLNLVSFSVKEVDLAHRSRKYLSVGGFLFMGITRDALSKSSGFDGKPRFQIWPGNSQLSISFEGIYTESTGVGKCFYSEDSLVYGGINVYKGSHFCEILEEVTQYQAFIVVPNWRCNGTDEFCSKLGPYTSGNEIKATDEGFKGVKIYVQNLMCEQEIA
ncbi:hypothetical protein CJ030_MR5G001788 [Morella rubra]|uniref:DUF2921 domain-containing protein n=1 Tax=Morella rubra TaxID=262757 RepID=A0A6A1VM54_9ROSI|nr:hypothetical protein CJ030_MR5G001788 [Morella rubra]